MVRRNSTVSEGGRELSGSGLEQSTLEARLGG